MEPDDFDEVRKIALEIYKRMTRMVLALVALGIVVSAYAAVTLHDQHIENCKPPRSETIRMICDFTFPLHDHPMRIVP